MSLELVTLALGIFLLIAVCAAVNLWLDTLRLDAEATHWWQRFIAADLRANEAEASRVAPVVQIRRTR